jgi:hypothetical protein
VDQIGDGTWGLFANQVILKRGEKYTARLQGNLCDANKNCASRDMVWSFTITQDAGNGNGDTSIPVGFPSEFPARLDRTSALARIASKARGSAVRMASQ